MPQPAKTPAMPIQVAPPRIVAQPEEVFGRPLPDGAGGTPFVDDIKPLRAMRTNLNPTRGDMPTDYARTQFGKESIVIGGSLADRRPVDVVYQWEADSALLSADLFRRRESRALWLHTRRARAVCLGNTLLRDDPDPAVQDGSASSHRMYLFAGLLPARHAGALSNQPSAFQFARGGVRGHGDRRLHRLDPLGQVLLKCAGHEAPVRSMHQHRRYKPKRNVPAICRSRRRPNDCGSTRILACPVAPATSGGCVSSRATRA